MGTRRAVLVTAIGNAIGPAVGLVTAPLLAVALGVSGRGELAAASAPLLLASNAATLGLPTALTYFTSRRTPRERRLITSALLLLGMAGLVATAIIVVLSPLLAAADRELSHLIVIAGLGTSPALVLAGARGVALGLQNWGLVTAEKLLGSAARLIALCVLFVTDQLTLLLATIVMSATTFVGIFVYAALPFVKRQTRPDSSRDPSVRDIVNYGARVWMGSLTGILLIRVGQTLMVPLSSTYELGLFAVAATLSEAALVFNAAVSTVVFSQESQRSDAARLAQTTRISTLITATTATAIAIASVWALPAFFGEDFVGALPALWILLAASVLGNSGSVAGQALNARGRPGLRSASLAIALSLNVGLIVALVPTLGSVGAAMAQLVANMVAGGLNLFWLRRVFALSPRDFMGVRGSDVKLLLNAVRRRS